MREHGNKGICLGKENIENQDFDFGEQGRNKAIYFRGTREEVPPWEGLYNQHNKQLHIYQFTHQIDPARQETCCHKAETGQESTNIRQCCLQPN